MYFAQITDFNCSLVWQILIFCWGRSLVLNLLMEIECYTICYWFIADDMIQIKAGHPYKLISCFTWSLLICLNIVLVNFWVDAIEICYFVLWHLYLVLLQRSMTETASFVLCRQWMLFCFVFLSYKVLYGTMLCICIISHFTKAVELLLSKCKCFDMSTEIWKMGCVSYLNHISVWYCWRNLYNCWNHRCTGIKNEVVSGFCRALPFSPITWSYCAAYSNNAG